MSDNEYRNIMKLVQDKICAIVLYQGYSVDDEQMFAYMAVRLDKHDAFARAVGGDASFDLREFGHVIDSGLGEPPADLMDEIERDFGVSHNRMLKFKKNLSSL